MMSECLGLGAKIINLQLAITFRDEADYQWYAQHSRITFQCRLVSH
jgi:hypothetical protein